MKSIIESIDFNNGLVSEIVGMVIELLILSIIVPIIIWLYNYRSIASRKYSGVLTIYSLIQQFCDQLGLLFDFDKLNLIEETTNKDQDDIFYKYYLTNFLELKKYYYQATFHDFTFYHIEPKLICLEHYCNSKHLITKDTDKLNKIIESLTLLVNSYENYQYLEGKNRKLQLDLILQKSIIAKTRDLLISHCNELTKRDLFYTIHNYIFVTMRIYFKYINFVDKKSTRAYYLSRYLEIDPLKKRNQVINKYYKKVKNNYEDRKRRDFWIKVFVILKNPFKILWFRYINSDLSPIRTHHLPITIELKTENGEIIKSKAYLIKRIVKKQKTN